MSTNLNDQIDALNAGIEALQAINPPPVLRDYRLSVLRRLRDDIQTRARAGST